MTLTAAIVLAAGEGTRMRSRKPKVLHEFAGKTFLNRVMDAVGALDPETLAVVVRYQAQRVAEAARSYDDAVLIVEQDEIPGTGRAVQCAMEQLGEQGPLSGTVLITASDMPLLDTSTLKQLLDYHRDSGDGATVLTTVLDDPTGYGRIIRDADGNVTGAYQVLQIVSLPQLSAFSPVIEAFIDKFPLPVALVVKQKIVATNMAYAKLTGYDSPDDMLGMPTGVFLDDSDKERFFSLNADNHKNIISGRTYQWKYRVRGKVRYVEGHPSGEMKPASSAPSWTSRTR